MNKSTDDYPPKLGLGELPWLRSVREHKALRVKVGAGMFISWENSNNPEWGEYYICVTAGGRTSQLEIDLFVPDVLTLKCWVLAKMEEYDVKAPRTSAGVSE